MKTLVQKQLQHYHAKLDVEHRSACSLGQGLTSSHGCCGHCQHNVHGLCHNVPLLEVKNKLRQSLFFFSRFVG